MFRNDGPSSTSTVRMITIIRTACNKVPTFLWLPHAAPICFVSKISRLYDFCIVYITPEVARGYPRGVVWFAILGRNLSSLKRVGNIEWVLDTIMSDEDRDVDIESDVIIHVTI